MHPNTQIRALKIFYADYAETITFRHLNNGTPDDFNITMWIHKGMQITPLIIAIVIPSAAITFGIVVIVVKIIYCVKMIRFRRVQRIARNWGIMPPVRDNLNVVSYLEARLKEVQYSKEIDVFSEPLCTICLCNVVNDRVVVLKCQHIFHSSCIMGWISYKASGNIESVRCPNCHKQLE